MMRICVFQPQYIEGDSWLFQVLLECANALRPVGFSEAFENAENA